ncbi:asparagine synthase (glutamine-hydrolysing) [Bifidobacterium bohemicum]|uniref:asparagine synthase (glutamine-hydrolyzing) n=1 Tax=Bifidobacterium bohemicum DSM 22767 TaxID=1437606 RepID=A0A086ZGC1_9BIFI|nr:asparagine synthase (glutamine-hydrolyzing) [Bifidobacterium bohemicum]KFI45571.1 asparagine synthase (glutamine-hydrolyzing) [Bifidobacterium bohemicum DSM 22767]SCC01639.1 asparagine synthase (glutamine-hydrolysing) [Bifidobacterium bohemicum]
MCGIVAFCDRDVLDKDYTIQSMMKMIQHRGPSVEGSGYYTNDVAALGFRRLSIIDLAGGKQPIFNEDESVLITFNGEIYNYQSLREELLAAGHTFRTKADTEVLLHGYEQWGMDGLLNRVRGMFAFLIWDDNKKTMYGARDFFGIKPLYYYHEDGTFIVGSEIKSFLVHPHFKKELNEKALKPFLMNQYNDLNETFFKNVYRFPAGHWFEFHDDQMLTHEYWDVDYRHVDYERGDEQTIDAIDKTVIDSVEAHRVADVKVGAFLSEGVDSSYVTTILRPNEVFSVNFDEGPFDEVGKAKELADHEGLHFNQYSVSGDEAFRDFAEMQYHMDEPDANASIIPLWYLCRLARKKVTVVLSGEGADELFAGYVNYGEHTRNKFIWNFAADIHKLPNGMRRIVANAVKAMPNFPGRTQIYTQAAHPREYYAGQAYIYTMERPTVFSSDEANAVLQPRYRNNLTVNGLYQSDFDKVEGVEELKQIQYIDLKHFMLSDILQKADKISMAHSLELRVPFLDRKVAELAQTIPSAKLLNSNDSKDIFRKAANRHLPEEWSKRPKLGFPTPIKTWLREENHCAQVRELYSEDWVAQFFDQKKILKLLQDNFECKVDARRQIWNIYTFLVWYKLFFIDFDQTRLKYERLQPDVQAFMDEGVLV